MCVSLFLFSKKQDKVNEEFGRKSFLADVYAHQGRFTEAARLYRENNEPQKAVAMYAGNQKQIYYFNVHDFYQIK